MKPVKAIDLGVQGAADDCDVARNHQAELRRGPDEGVHRRLRQLARWGQDAFAEGHGADNSGNNLTPGTICAGSLRPPRTVPGARTTQNEGEVEG